MNKKSSIIYKGTHYTACHMSDGALIVTSNTSQKGRRIVPSLSNDAEKWIDAICNAVDGNEAHRLCKSIMEG
jgi:hypothetical protein